MANSDSLKHQSFSDALSSLRNEPLFQNGPFCDAVGLLTSRGEDEDSLRLALARTLLCYASTKSIERTFVQLLPDALSISGSRFGFLAEVEYGASGAPYFLSHAVVDVYKPDFGPDDIVSGLQFHNLDTLNGAVMTSARPVLTNEPDRDPRRGGLPPGHATLESYLGLPFLVPGRSGGENVLVGGAALANRPGGYSEADIAILQPLCDIGALMIAGHREISGQHTKFQAS